MSSYSNRRYLAAKTTVDDRALNRHVVDRLRSELSGLTANAVRVLEVGGGLGTMVARLLDWGLLQRAEYRLVDVDDDLLVASDAWLSGWAAPRGYQVLRRADGVRLVGTTADVTVTFVRAEIDEYLDRDDHPDVDLVIANAFLDLVDVPRVLPRLLRTAGAMGLFWFPINYDGETIFQPDHAYDAALLDVYHRTMDERIRFGRKAGESRAGRHLFGHLSGAGATVLDAGASDWVVGTGSSPYPADEAYFLHHILHTIDEALRERPDVDAAVLERWLSVRRDQADRGELVYIAHQLDFVGRCRVESQG